MTALCAALLAAGAGAAAITVDVRRTDGSVSSRVRQLEVVDGVAAWRMTPAEVGDGVESVSVRSDFATARAGEEGYWVMPDNTLGTFKATNAVRSVSSSPMSFWGMKTSREAFVTRIDSMKYENEDLTLADERQFRFMADYREPEAGVTETVYENGTVVVVNRRKTACSCRGVEVPPRSWKRIDTVNVRSDREE